MLDSQLHPNFPSLVWQIAIPRSLILLILLHCITLNELGTAAAQKLQNITIPVTSPQITYTPFICNATTEDADPEGCTDAWQLSSTGDTISTTGPTMAGIIPQLFFQFQASVLYINTVPSFSNATVNLTISAGGTNISTIFDSSLGSVSIVDLPPNQTTSITLYVLATTPALFSMESLIITIPENSSPSSILPTLPSSASLPTFVPTTSSLSVVPIVTTPTAVPRTGSNRTKIGQAVGITVGLGLGLTALTVGSFYYWKRWKERSENVGIERAKSEWRDPPTRLSRFSLFQVRASRSP